MQKDLHFLYNSTMLVKIIKANCNKIRIVKAFCQSKNKSHQYFDFQLLEKEAPKMVELIEQCYSQTEDSLVLPNVKPGFLRHTLPKSAPEHGEPIEALLKTTKELIFPGVMNWQSPKYFGYYPSAINSTSVLAEMFSVAFHSPSFAYTVAPAFTELENIVMDWSAKALGLPEKFQIKNSGGGIINNSTTESIFVSVHAAKHRKMKELNIDRTNPQILKLVGYYGEGSHICSERGLFIKDIPYRRSAPYVYNPTIKNYEIDVDKFQAIIEEDIKNGLIPFWFGSSIGTTFSAAVDFNQRIVTLCKKHKIWINIDSAFLGSTWIVERYRPEAKLLQQVDSIALNFSKLLLNGTGGSLFYIGDKINLNESFGATALKFSFFKNEYSENHDIIDYKDWIVGLGRRNNALKIYYTFAHYGLNAIRKSVIQIEQKGKHLLDLIQQYQQLFEVHTYRFTVVTFRIKGQDGLVSDELTRAVAAKIKNIKEGFCSPSEFKGVYVIRLVVGNFHSQRDHIDAYVKAIAEETKKLIQSHRK